MVKVQDYNVKSSLSRVFYAYIDKKSQITKIVKKITRIAGDIAHKFERQKVKKAA